MAPKRKDLHPLDGQHSFQKSPNIQRPTASRATYHEYTQNHHMGEDKDRSHAHAQAQGRPTSQPIRYIITRNSNDKHGDLVGTTLPLALVAALFLFFMLLGYRAVTHREVRLGEQGPRRRRYQLHNSSWISTPYNAQDHMEAAANELQGCLEYEVEDDVPSTAW